MKNTTAVLLVGIGIVYTNLEQVASAFSLQYLLLVETTVIGVILGTSIVGQLLGFYPIEASITAGLCMANMGGTGDAAVLSVCIAPHGAHALRTDLVTHRRHLHAHSLKHTASAPITDTTSTSPASLIAKGQDSSLF